MTNDTDQEKAREWLSQRTVPLTSVEEVARFRAEAVVEGLRLAVRDSLDPRHRPDGGASARKLACAIADSLSALADEREPKP